MVCKSTDRYGACCFGHGIEGEYEAELEATGSKVEGEDYGDRAEADACEEDGEVEVEYHAPSDFASQCVVHGAGGVVGWRNGAFRLDGPRLQSGWRLLGELVIKRIGGTSRVLRRQRFG